MNSFLPVALGRPAMATPNELGFDTLCNPLREGGAPAILTLQCKSAKPGARFVQGRHQSLADGLFF